MKTSRRATVLAARSSHQRHHIAEAAARLMAQDGLPDYASAKRKAARQLGISDTDALPSDREVESALRTYQALYQKDEQPAHLRDLRQKSLELLDIFRAFRPYLTGPVLDGTAGKYAEIELLLYPESPKDVEIFLLNRRQDYVHQPLRHAREEANIRLDWKGDEVQLSLYPPQEERIATRNRARAGALAALLQGPASTETEIS